MLRPWQSGGNIVLRGRNACPGLCEGYPNCISCWEAQREQYCQSCDNSSWIREGDCVVNAPAGWSHVACPGLQDDTDSAIEAGLRPVPRRDPEPRTITAPAALPAAPHVCTSAGAAEPSGEEPGADVPLPGTLRVPNPEPKPRFRNAKARYTIEQEEIVNHVGSAKPGDIIRINARAGGGKTTTAALLCSKIVEQRSAARVAYFVFGKKAEEEAKASGKFSGGDICIMTTHAFAKKAVFPEPGKPVPSMNRAAVAQRLVLEGQVRERLERGLRGGQRIAQKGLRKVVGKVAGGVLKTLEHFFHGDGERVEKWQVPRKIRPDQAGPRSKWKKFVVESDYVTWAGQLFDIVKGEVEQCGSGDPPGSKGDGGGDPVGVTHDAYLKVFQMMRPELGGPPACRAHELECTFEPSNCNTKGGYYSCLHGCRGQGLKGQTFDHILIDEAQDLTPAQTEGFWKRQGRVVVWLIGDQFQRIYGWRGARTCFERAQTAKEFGLTFSFRFGSTIARAAQLVLARIDSNAKILGAGSDHGASVLPLDWEAHFGSGFSGAASEEMNRTVVLCRSNKGMINALVSIMNHSPDQKLPPWKFIDEKGVKGLLELAKIEKLTQFWNRTKARNHDDADDRQNDAATPGEAESGGDDWLVEGEESDVPVGCLSDVGQTVAGASASENVHVDEAVSGGGGLRDRWGLGDAADDGDEPAPSMKRGPQSAPTGGHQSTLFRHDGEDFSVWDDLKTYCSEFEHNSMLTLIGLVEEYGAETPRLLEQLRRSRVDSKDTEGHFIAVGTIHAVKGLEYDGTVVIYDDFSEDVLRLIMDPSMPLQAWAVEILNLLYVGITRARRTLRFAPGVWDFMRGIGIEAGHGVDEPEDEHLWCASDHGDPAEFQRVREKWESDWAKFDVDRMQQQNSFLFADLPPPPRSLTSSGGKNPFAMDPNWTSEEVKQFVTKALLRYHPDKLEELRVRAEEALVREAAVSSGSLSVIDRREKIGAAIDLSKRATQYLSRWKRAETHADPTVPFCEKERFAQQKMSKEEENGFLGAKRRRMDPI